MTVPARPARPAPLGSAPTGSGRLPGPVWRRLGAGDGFATVVAAAAMAALLVLTVLVVDLGAATTARHRAQSAADLAALAAAADALDSSSACAAASRIAAANTARLEQCVVGDLEVRVRTSVEVGLGLLGARTAYAAARAGPVAW